MWKAPTRPNNKITQNFNDGVLSVCNVENIAETGYQPKIGLTVKHRLRYEERVVGFSRYYSALQNQIEIEKVLRVPYRQGITNQDVVVLPDCEQYSVQQVQVIDVYPKCLDLSLSKIEQRYEVCGTKE